MLSPEVSVEVWYLFRLFLRFFFCANVTFFPFLDFFFLRGGVASDEELLDEGTLRSGPEADDSDEDDELESLGELGLPGGGFDLLGGLRGLLSDEEESEGL